LGIELSHISGSRIVHDESLPDIIDIVEILATLMRPRVLPASSRPVKPVPENLWAPSPAFAHPVPAQPPTNLRSEEPYTHFLDQLQNPPTNKPWISSSRRIKTAGGAPSAAASPALVDDRRCSSVNACGNVSDSVASGTLLRRVADGRSGDGLSRMTTGAEGIGSERPASDDGSRPYDAYETRAVPEADTTSWDRREERASGSGVGVEDDLDSNERLERDQGTQKPRKERRKGGNARCMVAQQRQRYKSTPLAAVVRDALGHSPRRSQTASPWVMWAASRAIAQYSADVSPRARRSRAAVPVKSKKIAAQKSSSGNRRKPRSETVEHRKPKKAMGMTTSSAPEPGSRLPAPISNRRLAAKLQFIYK